MIGGRLWETSARRIGGIGSPAREARAPGTTEGGTGRVVLSDPVGATG